MKEESTAFILINKGRRYTTRYLKPNPRLNQPFLLVLIMESCYFIVWFSIQTLLTKLNKILAAPKFRLRRVTKGLVARCKSPDSDLDGGKEQGVRLFHSAPFIVLIREEVEV